MGRFFSADALFTGDVPTHAAFAQVEDHLTRELVCNEVMAASVFGSAVTGTHNARSDLDVLVIAKQGAGWRLHAHRLAQLRGYAATLHVPLQLVVLDESQAVTMGHGVGAGLFAHLRGGNAKQIVGSRESVSFLMPPTQDAQSEAAHYRGRKQNRLQQDLYVWRHLAWSERLHAMERAADGPVHLARKIVHFMTDVAPADRKSILTAFAEVAEVHRIPSAARSLVRLVETNHAYGTRVLAQPFKPHSHSQLLKEFKSTAGYESALEKIWGDLSHNAWEFYNEVIPLF